MAQHGDRDDEDAARRTAALMGFVVILVLAIAGLLLVRELRVSTSDRGLPDVGAAQLRADRGRRHRRTGGSDQLAANHSAISAIVPTTMRYQAKTPKPCFGDEIDEPAHDEQRREKRHDKADRDDRAVVEGQLGAALVEIVDGGAEHRRDREEKRELGCRRAADPEHQRRP